LLQECQPDSDHCSLDVFVNNVITANKLCGKSFMLS
jgi:hypothetical protein